MTMSNKKKAAARPASAAATYKFAALRAEAARASAQSGVDYETSVPPFVIDDVAPPIVITAPDTLERQLIIAEMINEDGNFGVSQALPLLRALCGPAFARVWPLIKDDRDPNTAIAFVQALITHFYDALEMGAAEVPGGSEGSSD